VGRRKSFISTHIAKQGGVGGARFFDFWVIFERAFRV
jgi:hypothetical protein